MPRRIALYFVLALVLVMYSPGCAKPADVIVTAPKTRLAVGETVVLSARLAKTDSTSPAFHWWRTGLDDFELQSNVLTVKKPGSLSVCASHWYSYIPKPDSTRTVVRTGTESKYACIELTSSPAK